MNPLARRFEQGAQIGDGRALAVGAGDMDHRRQPILRIAQPSSSRSIAVEAEVDELGMKRRQALQDGVGAGHGDEILEQQHGALLAARSRAG